MDSFPIGFWNCVSIERQGPEAVADWADAGMTLPQGPNYDGGNPQHVQRMRAILDAALERGVRVILCDDRLCFKRGVPLDEGAYRADCRHAMETFGAHPALFGFHAGDEPVAADFENVCRAIRIQRELAPHLKPFCNLLAWWAGGTHPVGYTDWGKYLDDYITESGTDILCYDYYCQMNPGTEGWDGYFANLRAFQAAATRRGIPYWTTLLSTGHFNYRCPKEDDFRWQLNTALAHGARGVMWFMFYLEEPTCSCNYRVSPIDELGERTETYQWLSRICRTFLMRAAPVLQQLTLQKVMHVGTCWGGTPGLDGHGLVRSASSKTRPWGGGTASSTTPLIVSEFRHTDGGDFVMLVNNSQTDNTLADLCLQGHRPRPARVRWGAQETELPANELCVLCEDHCIIRTWLAPGQMELYRIRSGS